MSTTYNNELNEIFLEEDEVSLIQTQEYWSIYDLNTAIWADGIVAENEQKISEIEEIYQKRMNEFKLKMDTWKENASRKHIKNIEFFKTHLMLYHMRVLDEEKAKGAKKLSKTIKLPTRELKCVKQQPEIYIYGKEASKAKDVPEFVKYVKEYNPDYIKEEVKWGDLKKSLKQVEVEGKLAYVDETGQVLDFIELIEREESFDWKPIKVKDEEDK